MPSADVPSGERGIGHGVAAVAPGLGAAVVITVIATLLGRLAPVVGAPVFAIVIGMVTAAVRPPGPSLAPGIKFTSKKVLQGSIIVLGFGLSLGRVVHTGVESLPVLLGSLIGVLVLAWFVGRRLGVDRDTNVLIGVGTAICGASAIAAVNAVIDADDADVSYSIATIFLFN
ncbi:MAG: putative sulfate exporter family transporter, partial [Actinobacteria bacterium]|nr:putative sulfate exporter family transporter [Actinomycetota bacterium]